MSIMNLPLTFSQAAEFILREAGQPLHYAEITRRAQGQDLLLTECLNPAQTLQALLTTEIASCGPRSRFVLVSRGIFALKEDVDPLASRPYDPIPVRDLPSYPILRLLIPLWDGVSDSSIRHLLGSIAPLSGTPQDPIHWRDPDRWISERLDGEDRALARLVWEGTRRSFNPRTLEGAWRLLDKHLLLQKHEGVLRLTTRGQDFLDHPLGDAERDLDEAEGLRHLLLLICERGPVRRVELLHSWANFARQHSGCLSPSRLEGLLSCRLDGLIERNLVFLQGLAYQLTGEGLAYLQSFSPEKSNPGEREAARLASLVLDQKQVVRDCLREAIDSLAPDDFEALMGRLLEAMGYRNLEMISPSGGLGVEFLGDIQIGVTSTRDVIQIRRHKARIQVQDLASLRGCLHRFNARRGTLISNGSPAPGSAAICFEPGAAPVTLIDGEQLTALLLEHGLGVIKRQVELWEFDIGGLVERPGSFPEER
jgi:restriction system protein